MAATRRSRQSRHSSRRKRGNRSSRPTHRTRIAAIARKTFGKTTWLLTRHTRADGNGHWLLEEHGGHRLKEKPIVYDTGYVHYARPEKLPIDVITWTNALLQKYKRKTPAQLAAL